MITCNHCGRPNPANAASCQNCGAPFISEMGISGTSASAAPRMSAPDPQPELPAWLETLRSGERSGPAIPPSPGNAEPANFMADELIDEDMLPSWMRPERREMSDSGHMESYPPRRPAATQAPNTDHAFAPGGGMDASSLIDQQSLPSWLQDKQVSPPPHENVQAASLVQSESLPQWMKNVQARPAASGDARQNAQAAGPSQGIMGNDLIDGQGLPGWMSAQDRPPAPSAQPGLSASSLLDANALPSWLRQEGPQTQPTQGGPAPGGQTPQPTFSAPPSPAAQPLRGTGFPQGMGAAYTPAAYNQVPPGGEPLRPGQVEDASSQSNLSAASFIELDSLPGWLRASDEQGRQAPAAGPVQSFSDPARQATYGASARPVPSRPRGEMPAHEDSEVAANVFASMLGVASAAPYFPGQQPRDASAPPQGPGAPSPYPQAQPGVPMQAPNAAGMSHLGVPSGPAPQAYPGGMPNYMGVPVGPPQGYAPAAGSGSMPPGMPAPLSQQVGESGGQARQQGKPAKRGFLSTILDWFSR